uniref:Type II secretion system protein J n=1 Tax=termite gut metagenome TaxID=433724 RepID=S0DG47_9ZZZZ
MIRRVENGLTPCGRYAVNGFTPCGRYAVNGFTPCGRYAVNGFTPFRRYAVNGFTLVEMMVSLLIFALLAAAGVGLLAFSVRAQGATDSKLTEIAHLNQLGSALSGDLAQVRARATRDAAGNPLPVFTGASGSSVTPMLRLVRAGWTNVDEAPRPSEQKVEYQLADGVLTRTSYPMLDGAAPGPNAAILSNVSQVSLRYRYAGAWTDHWDGTSDRPLPDAVEMTIIRTDGPAFRELFLVGTGYRTPQELGANRAAS